MALTRQQPILMIGIKPLVLTKPVSFLAIVLTCCLFVNGQDTATAFHGNTPGIEWFRKAKFGMFIHWGLYSHLAGTYKGKNYYGSGEWIMHQAKIPAADYAKVAAEFNPTGFNAGEWAQVAEDAGMRYMVITAKHHEGFSMFDSKVSNFNIVKASPYGKDPMQALATETRKRGIRFGFYYSQFLDWHEPNGGGNDWDFDEKHKDNLQYYHDKSIPQLKELLSNYGPLGMIWFDQPGGLTKQQTRQMLDSLRLLQPGILFSSRVGEGLGDYTDFGDSEVPPLPVKGAWESVYTHNDSWGYIRHDMNFKSSTEIIRLLANIASKGGNLMLNVGPDGQGRMPVYSVKYLRQTGAWLKKNGESIYGSNYGAVPAQPWGVTTSKPGKVFLHVMNRPLNGWVRVPHLDVTIRKLYQLDNKRHVQWKREGNDVLIQTPPMSDEANTVFVVEYKGIIRNFDLKEPLIVSRYFHQNTCDAVFAQVKGAARVETITYSHYFGDWKNATVVNSMREPGDEAAFNTRFTEKGDYKIILNYACDKQSSNQEGILEINGSEFLFRTLHSSEYDINEPLLFIQHPVAILSVGRPGVYTLKVRPAVKGPGLFNLKSVIIEPVQ
jgi:alpha-L-fucosidase